MKRFNSYLQGFSLYLASRSPRRRELLTQVGIPFKLWLKDEIAEDFPSDLMPAEVAVYLARLKAKAYKSELGKRDILITADTLVVLKERILGKPSTREEAIMMLRELSNNSHEVITGVCLSSSEKESVFIASTIVWFDLLEETEIEEYVDEFSPYDKAGSYGIQEWIGFIGIHRIEGSYFNVMGLPIQSLYRELQVFTGNKSTSNP
jgi:septum formation protein